MAISRFKTSTLAQGLPKFQDLWDGTTSLFDSDMELIQRVTVDAAGASSINFTSIPGTFKHLQIRGIARTANAVTADQVKMQMNGDTSASNYTFHTVYGNGSSALADGYGANTVAGVTPIIRITGASATSGVFGATVTDILDYTNTNKNTTVRCLDGYDLNGSGEIQFTSGSWLNTSAVTSLSMTLQGSGNFAQYSQFALYGIKGIA
jgi:hypothetical protein